MESVRFMKPGDKVTVRSFWESIKIGYCVLNTTHPDKCAVTTCRAEVKVRKGGDFFYGKSENQNQS